HLDAALPRATQHLARDGAGIRDAVLPAARRSEHVVDRETRSTRRIDSLDLDPQCKLQFAPFLELRDPRLGRREEQVADLPEEARPELGEERDALAREHDLRRRRE